MNRSAQYWRDFGAHAHLRGLDLRTNKRIGKYGRGLFLKTRARKMVDAGLWTDIELKAMKGKVWFKLTEVEDALREVRA
jgi:hypothetical protein